ncbi:MAG: alpha/beta fold hydrolase, partial [Actinomycetota bacterium]|nr:alpha/beta fold hydrolase [Actinomycetota bacterium]
MSPESTPRTASASDDEGQQRAPAVMAPAEHGNQQWPPGSRLPAAMNLDHRAATSHGDIAFDVLGDGPPVVLVHGTPSRAAAWRDVASALSVDHRVYVYDLLGFGESERHVEQDVSVG